jgi:hypothetical protein
MDVASCAGQAALRQGQAGAPHSEGVPLHAGGEDEKLGVGRGARLEAAASAGGLGSSGPQHAFQG